MEFVRAMDAVLPLCGCAFRGAARARWQSRRAASTRSHYAALGITPAATQADVKAAYYRLTKLYHPDRLAQRGGPSAAEEATQKFRDVTAAYEVLGNVKLRKLYDKGMYHDATSRGGGASAWRAPAEDDDDPTASFHRSRERRSRPPPPTKNQPLYDFDEWSKQHYGATFARDQQIKRNRERRATAERVRVEDVKVERVLIVMGVCVITLLLINNQLDQHDRATYDRKADQALGEAAVER